jgi:hypothetical protein
VRCNQVPTRFEDHEAGSSFSRATIRPSSRVRAVLVLMVAFCVVIGCPGSALAGTYVVHSCHLPDGKDAPARGWTEESTAWGSGGNNCWFPSTPGSWRGISVALDFKTVPSGGYGQAVFEAPPNTSIVGYALYGHEEMVESTRNGSLESWIFHDTVDDAHNDFRCSAMSACIPGTFSDPLVITGLNAHSIIIRALCNTGQSGGACDARQSVISPLSDSWGGRSGFRMQAARITLKDLEFPTLDSASAGPLFGSDGPLQGVETATVLASDVGGGVSRLGVAVDGAILKSDPFVGAKGATCVEPFVELACPRSASGTISFDTTNLANGAHVFQAVVWDAAGNRTLGERHQVVVGNPGAPNGTGASRFAELTLKFKSGGSTRRTVDYGRRATVVGMLSASASTPVSAGVLDVATRVDRPGSPWVAQTPVITDSAGRFEVKVPVAASREVRVSYRAFGLDEAAVATRSVLLRVRAGVTLSITPRKTSALGRVNFHGRLRGGPFKGGTQVALYAVTRGARKRIPVEVLTANSSGRFEFKYRFSGVARGPVRYRFVARVNRQAGYPYEAGQSPVASVRVG